MDRNVKQLLTGILFTCVAATGLASAPEHRDSTSIAVLDSVSRYGVFHEPLVPFISPTKAQVDKLTAVINDYGANNDPADVAVLKDYLSQHPASPWRASLLLNMALAREQAGYYTDAITLFKQSSEAGKAADRPEEKTVAARALGELLSLYNRFGNKDALKKYLAEVTESPVNASVSELIAEARSGLWQIENTPEDVLTCGLEALDKLLALQSPAETTTSRFSGVKAGKNGISLARLKGLATGEGVSARLVKRNKADPFPVPAVMHMNVGHYATVLQERSGRFEVYDPTLSETLWFTSEAIEAESSGHFLVLQEDTQSDMPWAFLDDISARVVLGAGYTNGDQIQQTSNCDHTDGDSNDNCGGNGNGNPSGMPSYRVHSMLVSLNITDTPLGYTPPIGPAIPVTISYSQREALEPSTFTYGNLGHKWLFNWSSYIQDDPQQAGSRVRIYLRGGGSRDYGGYNSGTGAFTREQRTGAVLTRTSGLPIQYERELANGYKYLYAETDGSTFYPRRVFLSRVIDPSGNAVELNYDSQQRLISLTDALGQVTEIHYDQPAAPLLITGATDPFGRTATFNYDASGRLDSITDAEGMTSTFDYDSGTFIEAMTTPYGTTSFQSGQSGTTRWVEITDPKGERERVEHRHGASGIPFSDSPVPSGMSLFNQYINGRNTFYWDKEAMKRAPGNYTQARIRHWYHLRTNSSLTTGVLESIKNPLERRVWFNYPGQNWAGAEGTLDKPSVIGRVLPDGTTQLKRRSYNSRGNLTQTIDPLGREIRYEYAANDIDLTQILRKTASGFEVLATFTYNGQHRPLTYTGPDGQIYSYTYTPEGQLQIATNPLGQMTTYDYDSQGYLLGITDPNGVRIVSYTYDSIGRKISETNAVGYRIEYSYDNLNRLVEARYPDGTSETHNWDKLDRISMTDRYGNTIQYTYDEVRNRIASLDASGHLTQYDYFADSELQGVTDGKGNTTAYERDIQSRIIKTIRPDSNAYQIAYDNSGRQTSNTDPLGGVTRLGYEWDDKLDSVTDPKGNVTTYNYDAYTGLLAEQNSPDAGTTTYEYDSDNNLIRRVDANGNNTTFGYDPLNRIRQIDYRDGQSVTYTHDAGTNGKGRLTGLAEDDITTTFSYDQRGNVTHRTQNVTSGPPLIVEYSYTPAGNIARMVYPSGAIVDYQYVNDRLTKISANGETVLNNIQYEPFGPMKSWQWGNGQTHSQSHDAAGLLATFSVNGDTLHLSYDSLNNIMGIDDSHIDQDFVYDYLDRLTEAQSTGSTAEQNFDVSYDYDANGNRTRAEVDGITKTYTVEGSRNHLIDVDGTAKTYDANGNLVNDGTHTYQYDARNRMVSVDNGDTGLYKYNALGQRIYKKGLRRYQLTADLNGDGEVTNDDIHHLNDLIKADKHPAYADLTLDGVVDKKDNACVATRIGNNPNANVPPRCHIGEWVETTVESHFLYQGPNLLGEYDNNGQARQEVVWMGSTPVAVLQGNQLYKVHADYLDTPVVITDNNNTIVWRWDRKPFGDTFADDDPDGDGQAFVFNLRFPGQHFDAETGQHYNYFRAYDPSTGRYIQSDPIGLDGGLNTYLYVNANPLRFTDPRGLDNVGCTTDPLTIDGRCKRICCAIHDKCYDDNNCTADSWTNDSGCNAEECDNCNKEVVKCFVWCDQAEPIGIEPAPGTPEYYCPAQHRYIKVPGDFPTVEAAKAVCGS